MRLFFYAPLSQGLIETNSKGKGQVSEHNGWYIDKRLSITHLITTLSAIVAFVFYAARIESKVEINANAINANAIQIARVEVEQDGQYSEIIRRLERIGDKLDAKADR